MFWGGHGSSPGLGGGTAQWGDYRFGLLPRLLEHGAAGITCVGTGCGHFRCGGGHVEAFVDLFYPAQFRAPVEGEREQHSDKQTGTVCVST